MKHPWDAEQDVSPDRALRLVADAAPALADASIQFLDQGWDNTAYLVDDRWVFRFPRRSEAVSLMENELRVLPRIAPLLPLAVPVPVHVGSPVEDYPWPYAGYAYIPGEVAALQDLARDARRENAAALGGFLAALHGLETRELRERGLPPDELRRLDPEFRVPRLAERLTSLARAGHIEDGDRLLGLARDSVPSGWTPRGDVVVHGDLDARHLLVDDGDRLTGVIDFGDLHAGDPAADLAVAFTFLPPSARADFRDAYGSVDPDSWAMARFRSIHNSLVVLEWALESGRDSLAREARLWLEHASLE